VCGLCIFFIHIFIPNEFDFIYLVILTSILFLISAQLFRTSRDNRKKYAFIFYAFSIAALVNTLQWYWGGEGFSILEIVLNKLISTTLVLIPIIILIDVSGNDMGSLYLKKGNLRLGLIIGIATFLSFFITAIPAAIYIFGGVEISLELLINLLPWILTFTLLNALREGIWFRGLFLKRFEEILGKDSANICQALIFAFAHLSLPLSSFFIVYFILTFILGLGFGAVMQKTDSIIGAFLFHAGADIPVILAVFSGLV
jgi:membrane protease YdiL (CAAX protease family)